MVGVAGVEVGVTTQLTTDSGIFGYINYLVEKDRKFILDTLVNGNKHAHHSV